jgi:predicted Ser/Thr protein kinase
MSAAQPESDGQTIDQILAIYHRRCEEGEAISLDELLRQYPDHAADLRQAIQDEKVYGGRLGRLRAEAGTIAETAAQEEERIPIDLQDMPDYLLVRKIGKGGMGVVFEAVQKSIGRRVALKVMSPVGGISDSAVARFQTETKAAGQLRHPNIVQILEASTYKQWHYYTMPLIDGSSLGALDRGTVREEVERMICVADAIDFAHRHGVIHRDLKPENILVDAQGTVFVTDFGLAKLIFEDDALGMTATGAILGTPRYMSPEQAAGESITTASDIHAIGAVAYNRLSGRDAFSGDGKLFVLERIRNEIPSRLYSTNTGIDRDLDTIVAKCLEKKPEDRYPTAGELSDDLRRWLDGKPIVARPMGRAEYVRRWCRRNPLSSSLIAVAIGTLLIGFFGTLWQWRLAEQERMVAATQLAENQLLLAKLSAQRGDWNNVLNIAATALESSQADIPAIRFFQAEALAGLNQLDQLKETVSSLKPETLTPEHLGLLRLWQGELAEMQGRTDEATRLYQEALAAELPPDEDAYVRACLAETAPEAIEYFRQSLEANPFHYRSSSQLAVELVISGRFDEALEVCSAGSAQFPSSSAFTFTRGLVYCLQGDQEAARDQLEMLRGRLNETEIDRIQTVFAILHTAIANYAEEGRSLTSLVPTIGKAALPFQQEKISVARLPRRMATVMQIAVNQFSWLDIKKTSQRLQQVLPIAEFEYLAMTSIPIDPNECRRVLARHALLPFTHKYAKLLLAGSLLSQRPLTDEMKSEAATLLRAAPPPNHISIPEAHIWGMLALNLGDFFLACQYLDRVVLEQPGYKIGSPLTSGTLAFAARTRLMQQSYRECLRLSQLDATTLADITENCDYNYFNDFLDEVSNMYHEQVMADDR